MKMSPEHIAFVEQYAQEALRLAQHTGDQKIRARSLSSLATVYQVHGNLPEADRHLEAALHISRREGYTDALPHTLAFLCAQSYWQGKFPPVLRLGQEGVSVARETADSFHELLCLAFLCLSHWSVGDARQALTLAHEVEAKARERNNMYFLGRMRNTFGWFYREFMPTRAVECNQESVDLGRTTGISNVEVSALINLGFDYLALAQYERARFYLEPTLDRVEREAFGAHRWRWKMKLCLGLAELAYTTGAYDHALRYVEEGLKEAQATSSQKYMALGWALRGKIVSTFGETDTAGAELQRAFTLADQLQSPALVYPIAYDLGQWYETHGREHKAVALYATAKTTIEHMATAIEDDVLSVGFRQSALVQAITERAARLGI